MQREAAYPIIVILLVLSVVAAGFPLADLLEARVSEPTGTDAPAAASGQGDATPGAAASDFFSDASALPPEGDALPTARSSSSSPASAPSSPRSTPPPSIAPPLVPDRLNELAQILLDAGGTLAGAPIALPRVTPDFPAGAPLKAALIEWIQVTGADVPEDELAKALADADAVPLPAQHDLALLVAAASKATLLQREALAAISPDDMEFLETHPEAVRALAEGRVDDPDFARVGAIARQVDITKSVQASLLLVGAVRHTRDGLREFSERGDFTPASIATSVAPAANALALLDALRKAEGASGASREEKVRVAGDLLVAASGLAPVHDPRPFDPSAVASPTPLADALLALLHAADPVAPRDVPTLLAPDLAKANALPIELQRALARILLARAEGIAASRAALLSGAPLDEAARVDVVGQLKTLSAIEQAMPVIEKFNVIWSAAPRAQRLGVVDPAVGYAGALTAANAVAKTASSLEGAVSAAAAALGVTAATPDLGEADFREALAAFATARGKPIAPADLDDIMVVADALPPRVRLAATHLLRGSLAAHEAREIAFADLTPEDVAFLFATAEEIERIVASETTTAEDLETLARYADLASRIDEEALLAGALALARATDDAMAAMARWEAESADPAYDAQSARARVVDTGFLASALRLASRFSPVGLARAQVETETLPFECNQIVAEGNPFVDCSNGVVLNARQTIVILDGGSSILALPAFAPSIPIILDAGGNDVYRLSNGAASEINWAGADSYVGVLLDWSGDDTYDTPNLYPPVARPGDRQVPWRGSNGAGLGGFGFLVDRAGQDVYRSFTHSQGFGWHGVGVLADYGSGVDRFTARYLAQGATYGGFGLSLGLMINQDGNDFYTLTAKRGQGYGLGGVFADLKGLNDSYVPSSYQPLGIDTTAYVSVGQEPGRLLATRDDNKVWTDGPNLVQRGVGIDTELELTDADGDQWPTLIEAIAGSNPTRIGSTPQPIVEGVAGNASRDSDHDGWLDTIERALGTDAADRSSAPAGLPSLPLALVPVLGPAFLEATSQAPALDSSDKILDVRVPFAGNALHLRALCANYLAWQGSRGGFSGSLGAPMDDDDAEAPLGLETDTCRSSLIDDYGYVRGLGNTTLSSDGRIEHTGGDRAQAIALTTPPGLFALGDVVATKYAVDYLVSVDLAGSDVYTNRAGGGGVLRSQVAGAAAGIGSQTPEALTAAIPVGYVTLDFDRPLAAAAAPIGGFFDMYAAGRTATRRALDAAHGAAGGILVDAAGIDFYVAGSESQGALGGILLDLEGGDRYQATDRSQGATNASQIVQLTGTSSIASVGRSYSAVRHAFAQRPAMLLDFQGDDAYVAVNRSQGYGRGAITVSAVNPAAVEGIGLLADFDGKDSYSTTGRFVQGVSRGGATGLLVDFRGNDSYRSGHVVSMGAVEPPTSDRLARGDPITDSVEGETSGLGALLDFGGSDGYRVAREWGLPAIDRTGARQDNVTFAPAAGASVRGLSGVGGRTFATTGAGLHADVEGANSDKDGDGVPDFMETIAGTNARDRSESPSSRDEQGFLVNLPSARLAIGGRGPQTYSRDYAFAVDFGGANVHANNAAGPVVALPLAEDGSPQVRFLLTAFPVTFVYEVANADTTYDAARDAAQAVGYFTVGVVVDEGGADAFRVPRDPRPVFPSRWTTGSVVLDGVIGAKEWNRSANTTRQVLALEDPRSPGSQKHVELYVMNDADYVYVAAKYRPPDGSGGKVADVLARNWMEIQFDTGHDHSGWTVGTTALPCNTAPTGADATSGKYDEKGRPGTDGVRIEGRILNGILEAYANDTHYRASPSASRQVWWSDCGEGVETRQDVKAARSYRDGYVQIELRKPIQSSDAQDLSLEPDGLGAFLNPEVGFRIAIGNRITNETFAWPPRAAGVDGEPGTGTLDNSDFGDELTGWAALTFAGEPSRVGVTTYSWADSKRLGQAKTDLNLTGVVGVPVKLHEEERALSQGAALGGVGVLAMLGNARSSATLDADLSAQGFASFGGVGVLYDAGGSDRYHAIDFAQGSQILQGVAALVDVEGNDVYDARAWSQGFAFGVPKNSSTPPSGSGLALVRDMGGAVFLDQGGDDAYAYGQEALRQPFGAKTTGPATTSGNAVPSREGVPLSDSQSRPLNDRAWTQPTPWSQEAGVDGQVTVPFGGFGMDYRGAGDVFYRLSDAYRSMAWNPTVAYQLGEFVTTGSPPTRTCRVVAPANDDPTDPIYVVAGEACVRAFVYFQDKPGTEITETDAGISPPGTSVERLDVIVDDYLMTTTTAGAPVTASAFGFAVGRDVDYNYRGFGFVVPWDTRGFEDGPRDVRLRAYYATSWQSAGADPGGTPYRDVESEFTSRGGPPPSAYTPHRVVFATEKSADVFVDNLPTVAASASPRFPSGIGAAFSPAAIGAPNALTLKWAPSHDMGEDRHEFVNYDPSSRNAYCDPLVPAARPAKANEPLCHVIPFYVDDSRHLVARAPSSDFSTVFASSNGTNVDFTLSGAAEELVIPTGRTIRLVLYREAVLKNKYTTEVQVYLDNTTNDPVIAQRFTTPTEIGTVPSEALDSLSNIGNAIPTPNPGNPGGPNPGPLPGVPLPPLNDLRCVVDDPLVAEPCEWPHDLWEAGEKGEHYANVACTSGVLATQCNTLDPPDGSPPPRVGPSGSSVPPALPALAAVPKTYVWAEYEVPHLRPSTLIHRLGELYTRGYVEDVDVGRARVVVRSPFFGGGEPQGTASPQNPDGWVGLRGSAVGVFPQTLDVFAKVRDAWRDLDCHLNRTFRTGTQCGASPVSAPGADGAPEDASASTTPRSGGSPAPEGGDAAGEANWMFLNVTVPGALRVLKDQAVIVRVTTTYDRSAGSASAAALDAPCKNLRGAAGALAVVSREHARAMDRAIRDSVACPQSSDASYPEIVNYWNAERYPTRVEVLVPSEPSTHVAIRAERLVFDANGTVVSDRPGPVIDAGTVAREGDLAACTVVGGPRPTCRTTTWDGSNVTGGWFNLTFEPRTITPPLHPLAGDRADSAGLPVSLRVLLDDRAPVTAFHLPQTAAMKAAGAMRSVLGRGFLASGTQFPITFRTSDPGAVAPVFEGSGVERVQVWVAAAEKDGSIPDFPRVGPSPWKMVRGSTVDGNLPPTVREVKHIPGPGEYSFYVAVVGRDNVGNVDGLSAGWRHAACATPTTTEVCIAEAMKAAVRAKINRSRDAPNDPLGLYRVDLDLGLPVLSNPTITGAMEGVVSGIVRRIVRAGDDVRLGVCATDAAGESGVERVKVYFVLVPDDPTKPVLERSYEMVRTSTPDCYAFNDWGRLNTNKALFPDGAWTIGFEATDLGGNKGELDFDDVFLDSAAPLVTADTVVLPEGQTAVKSGDRFEVLLKVTEGVALDESRMTLDASALNRSRTIGFSRATSGDYNYRAVVRVDAPGLVNGPVSVRWTVADAAGNSVSRALTVRVDVRDFEIVPGTVRVDSVAFDSAVLHWRTTEPTNAKAAWGVTRFDLRKGAPATTTYVRSHAVELKGLEPSTIYFVKAVSTSEGGIVRESEPVQFETTTALYLADASVERGDAISGTYNLTWGGGLRTGDATPRFTIEMKPTALSDWEFVTTISSSSARHSVALNTSRFLDGADYRLRIRVELGRDEIPPLEIGPFTIDNTPPDITLLTNTKATREATPSFHGEAKDALSGLDVASFALTIDGKPQEPTRFVVETPDATGTAGFAYGVLEPLGLGPHAVAFSARDRAGAERVVRFTLHVDLVPPDARALPPAYTPGPTAARRDGTVKLSVQATDGAGVEAVVADLSKLVANANEMPLAPDGADTWSLAFVVNAVEADGTIEVPVRLEDPAGNARTVLVPVRVDVTAPDVQGVSVEDVAFTTARVKVKASEPVSVTVAFESDASRGEAVSDGYASNAVVPLKGLLPSRVYGFQAKLVDGAGNEATAKGSFSTTRDLARPGDVPTLRVIDLRDGRLRLEWTAANDDVGVAHYRVYRAGEGGTFKLLGTTLDTWYEESGLPLETTFSYRVAAVDHGGNEGGFSPTRAGASTSPPRLSAGLATPDVGNAGTTTFTFRVNYSSPGGVSPTYVRTILDGVPREMVRLAGGDPKTGMAFEHRTSLDATTIDAPHTFQFEASDGRYIVKFPADAPVPGPLVSGDLLGEESSGFVSFAKRVPLVGVLSILGTVAVAAAAVLVIRRRSK